ncbi:MAG: ABC transporter ATP-binding protein, partial [Desulfobacterales bacterium]
MSDEPVLEVRNLTKRFGNVTANRNVDFELRKGEIHVLLGENGAGKSTLINVLSGLYPPDEGEIYIRKQRVSMKNTRDGLRLGIGMVHQHFMLVPVFTVAENIILGNEMPRGIGRFFLDMAKTREEIKALSKSFGLTLDPDAPVETLSVGAQQWVEILKALYRQATIMFLDEPTAVLTPREVQDLFEVMDRLTKTGVSIVFITHKLKEVMAIADRITVMRRGQVVGTLAPDETDEQRLAEMMVGRAMDLNVEKGPNTPGPVVLEVRDLTVRDDRKTERVRQLSFQVRSGEILGIAGIQGNGQTELTSALAGLRDISSGAVLLDGKIMPPANPRAMVNAGMAHIPEDRLRDGLVLPFSIADNQVLCTYYQHPFAVMRVRTPKALIDNAKRLIERFDIRAPGPLSTVGTLSGGNQQKVVVSRELSREVRFLLA